MEIGHHGAHDGTQDADERLVERFHQRDLVAPFAARGGHLAADEAGAHDHDAGRVGVEVGTEPERVVELVAASPPASTPLESGGRS